MHAYTYGHVGTDLVRCRAFWKKFTDIPACTPSKLARLVSFLEKKLGLLHAGNAMCSGDQLLQKDQKSDDLLSLLEVSQQSKVSDFTCW